MDLLYLNIVELLVEKYLRVIDALALFCTSKKWNAYHYLHQDTIICAKKGWRECIVNGKIKSCQLIYEKPRNRLCLRKFHKKFQLSCEFGQLEIVQWLVSLGYQINWQSLDILDRVCINGHVNLIRWLLNIYDKQQVPTSKLLKHDIFLLSCINGHLEISKLWIKFLEKRNIVYKYTCMNSLMYLICRKGYLPIAQWLFEWSYQFTPDISYDSFFSESCYYGHTDMAKWFYNQWIQRNQVFEKHVLQSAFIRCCHIGNLSLAQWLVGLGDFVDIHEQQELAFRTSCEKGNFDIAKWLYQIGLETHSLINPEIISYLKIYFQST